LHLPPWSYQSHRPAQRSDKPVAHPLAFKRQFDGRACTNGKPQRFIPDGTQITRDFVSQHFHKPETEEMRRIAAIGPCTDVAPKSCLTPRTTVTGRAAVRQPRPQRRIFVNIARGVVAHTRTLALVTRKFALQELPPAAD